MSVDVGTRLGSLEITALLGKGGMGEVYRARDTKLKRDVAIKILPDEFSRDADRVCRFQREAEVLAALNHPNIAAIYDLQEANGSRYLVLELVEGETLADRIARGPIPVEEAFDMARNICEALEAAHEKGIIHRDLKPANVKITPDGKVKVLDFGLAKAMSVTTTTTTLSNSPTLLGGSLGGMIVGTAAYMSPEQARGREADQRSDVFAFGCVLYEMLTGRQAFQGEDVSDVLAAVLRDEPDLNLLPTNLNPGLLRRCLAKNRKDRWYAVGDLRVEIETILTESHGLKAAHLPSARMPRWGLAAVISITALLAAIATAEIVWLVRPNSPASIMRFSFVPPEGQVITRGGRPVIAISPDGQNIVYQANRQLYLRSMTAVDARPMEGTNLDAADPFFSPDGKWLGFYAVAERKLKKIAITGGSAVTVSEVDFPFSANWTGEGQILLADPRKGIIRVSANGGTPETLIAAKAGEVMLGPQLLPDRDHVLFTVSSQTSTGAALYSDKAQIVAQSLKSGERKTLVEGGADARYVATGHLVYAIGNVLFAVPFDLAKVQVTGGPVPVVEGVERAAAPGNSGPARYAISDQGTLIYVLERVATQRILSLAERNGAVKPLPLPPKRYVSPRLSPDGRKLVVQTEDVPDKGVLWVYDIAGTTDIQQLTLTGNNIRPIWTPDSKRVTFASDRDGPMSIYSQPVDGSGVAEPLTKAEKGTEHWPESWSPDGRTLSFALVRDGGAAVWTLSGDTGKTQAFADEPKLIQRGSAFSPDGRWLAYPSNLFNESSAFDVYGQPFPPTGVRNPITQNGRTSAVWSSGGKELFSTSQGRRLTVRSISTSGGLTFGSEQ
jgi:serine/threonine-protein kinase